MIAATVVQHGLTADQWILVGGIVVPILTAWLAGAIKNTRKQLGSVLHELHQATRILNGVDGVGPGLVKRVDKLEESDPRSHETALQDCARPTMT